MAFLILRCVKADQCLNPIEPADPSTSDGSLAPPDLALYDGSCENYMLRRLSMARK